MPDTTSASHPDTFHPDFRALFEAVTSACLILAPDLTIIAVNETYLRATMTRRDDIIGRSVFEAFPDNPDDPGATGARNLNASLERVLATRRPDVMPEQKYDIQRPQALGGGFEERYWRPINTPVLDGKGEIAWILHQVEDVTERILACQETERAHVATTMGRQAILDSVGEGFIVMDRDFRLVEVNREAERLDGRGAAELLGRTLWEAWPASVGSPVEEHYRRAMRERVPVTFDHRYVGEGHDKWLEIRAYPCEAGLAVLYRDVTNRKWTEERLHKSEDRFRALVEASSEVVYTMSPDWSELGRLNGAGFLPDAPEPMEDWKDTYMHPEDRSRCIAAIEEAIRTKSVFDLEHRVWRADGTPGWTHSRAVPVLGPDGEITEWFGMASDITDRKRAEEALSLAKEQSERANVAKSKFLAAASHDLRQPMQSLLLFLEVLTPHVGPKGLDALKHLGRGLDALRDLLDSLLDISRLDAGIVEPVVKDFVIQDLVGQIGGAYTPIAAAKGITFQVSACPAVVRSDRTLLGRMVRNLVENALRYTETGRIAVECHQAEDHVRLEVHDTGIGIQPEHLEWIWEEFHQVGNPERDRNHGLGLGLAIVQRLSTLLGHRVHVRSTPGEGSVFCIEVPLGEAVPVQPAASATEVAGNGRFAVVVDDDAIVLLGLKATFESWGYAVLAASSTDRALTDLQARGRRPDIVVADYRLRERRSGTEAVLRIREAYGADVPGIILTGEIGEEVRHDAAAHGLRVIHKPVTPRQLAEALERLLAAGR